MESWSAEMEAGSTSDYKRVGVLETWRLGVNDELLCPDPNTIEILSVLGSFRKF
jgi:hypothetical protein